jgi:hypothetical protein
MQRTMQKYKYNIIFSAKRGRRLKLAVMAGKETIAMKVCSLTFLCISIILTR